MTTTVSAANTTLRLRVVRHQPQRQRAHANTSTPKSVAAQQSIDTLQASKPPPASPSRKSALAADRCHCRTTLVQAVASAAAAFGRRQFQSIYGFSVYNPGTGEAYIIEIVDADLAIPDQLPDPTRTSPTIPTTSASSSSTR